MHAHVCARGKWVGDYVADCRPARILASDVPRYLAMASDSRARRRASRTPASAFAGSTLICRAHFVQFISFRLQFHTEYGQLCRPGPTCKSPRLPTFHFVSLSGFIDINLTNIIGDLKSSKKDIIRRLTFKSSFFTVVEPQPCHDVLVVPSFMILGFCD